MSLFIRKKRRIHRERYAKKRILPPNDYCQNDEIETEPCPTEIKNISDLINFSYLYKGEHVRVEKIRRIIPYLEELNAMVGMTEIKQSIVEKIMYFVQDYHIRNNDYLHMAVFGPPGCGKTSVCKIIGKILAGIGVLSTDNFTIIKRTDFVAKYLGQTAQKTKNTLEKCLGGVIFIDEVYSLAPRDTDRDSFAKEAIDYLNQFLSEHKDDVCCIIAGYEKEIYDTFFAMNAGLERRFPWKFTIEPYTGKEMLNIFIGMVAKEGYILAPDAVDDDFFVKNVNLFKHFGGDVETFLSLCKIVHSKNTFGSEPSMCLTKKDLEESLSKIQTKKPKNDFPSHLYT